VVPSDPASSVLRETDAQSDIAPSTPLTAARTVRQLA
jgi:hypothetical protein